MSEARLSGVQAGPAPARDLATIAPPINLNKSSGILRTLPFVVALLSGLGLANPARAWQLPGLLAPAQNPLHQSPSRLAARPLVAFADPDAPADSKPLYVLWNGTAGMTHLYRLYADARPLFEALHLRVIWLPVKTTQSPPQTIAANCFASSENFDACNQDISVPVAAPGEPDIPQQNNAQVRQSLHRAGIDNIPLIALHQGGKWTEFYQLPDGADSGNSLALAVAWGAVLQNVPVRPSDLAKILPSLHGVVEPGASGHHKLYVFWDPNCIFCHRLFGQLQSASETVKALRLSLVWVPVGVVSETSPAKATAVMAEGYAALVHDEAHFDVAREQGAAQIGSLDSPAGYEVAANALFMHKILGNAGTPAMLFLGKDGLVHDYVGMPRGDIRGFLKAAGAVLN